MSAPHDIDVVIVTYNSAHYLHDCVTALPAEMHVIVIDNASQDGSAELAEALGCDVLRNVENEGFGRAVNRAVRERVDATTVLLLNPDARITGASLELLRVALKDDGVAVAGPRLHDGAGNEQRPWWEFPSPGLAWREAFGFHRLRRLDFGRSSDVPFVVGACFLIRTDAFRDMGGFDERYWLYGEEADLCRRLVDAGWRVRYVAEAHASHAGGASSDGPGNPTIREHFMRGSDRFVLTHHGAPALVSYRIAGLVGSTLRAMALRPSDPRRDQRAAFARRHGNAIWKHPTLVTRVAPPVRHRCLVVCSLEEWDTVWRRNQFLVRELTAADPSLRVLFVEPARDPLHDALVRHTRPARRSGRLRSVPGHPQVIRFQPVKYAPRRLGGWVDQSLARQVLRAAARAEMFDPTLWINDLSLVPLTARSSWPVLYDVTDDWLAAKTGARELARRSALEERLLRIAGCVVVCSPGLAATKGSTRAVTLVPNAVDAERFRVPRSRPADLPSAPLALYVGTLHEDRLDVDLLLDAACRLPDLNLVLVGPNALSNRSTERLEAAGNVQIMGARSFEEVPAYLQHATVVIVPHVVSEFTESLDPIKAYESLAIATPTLATPVAGFRELEGSVTIAEPAEYVSALRRIVDGSAPVSHPVRNAQLPNWSDRARVFDEALRAAARAPVLRFEPHLRVVYVGHSAQLSGGELALARLLPALALLGIDAHVLLGEGGPLVDELRARDLRVEVLPLGRDARDLRRNRVTPTRLPLRSAAQTARYVWQLRRRLKELNPDIVHTNTLKAAVYGGAAARLAGVPVVWHIRDRIAPDYLPRSSVLALRLLARVLPRIVITNSRATRATLGALESRAAAVPSPVLHDAVEHPLGLPDSPRAAFTVGMVGRLSQWKGQHIFLDGFARAFPDGTERAVVIGAALFGEDEYAASLPNLAERLSIADRVDFVGFQNDVFGVLAELDVLVHASTLPEPFGQVVIEGMAAGLPVIAAAAGGPTEIITDDVDGILVPPNDPDALARALVRLAGDPQLRSRLGERARRRARDFRPERVAAEMANVYRRVLPIRTAAP